MMERQSIKLKRYDIHEYVKLYLEEFEKSNALHPDLKLVNVRGCNGSGKSTIPLQLLANDRATFLLTEDGKDVATVFPSFEYIAMGKYRTKTGGLDGYKNGEQTERILGLLCLLPYNILMEGVISSTIFSTYAELFKKIERDYEPKRKVGIMSLLPPIELVRERLNKRNGGKEIKFDQVESKWRTVNKNVDKFAEAGLISWRADNSGIALEETVSWFFEQVDSHIK